MPFTPPLARTALLAGGVLHLLWAGFHLAFPRLFRWDTALAALDRVNGSILRVLTLCLTFQFLVLGWLSLAFTDELLTTPLGQALCAGLAGFWLLRLGLQFVVCFWAVMALQMSTASYDALLGRPIWSVSFSAAAERR